VLDSNGWDLVRRPTGGRAILHADELTYSVIGPKNEPRLAKDILHSYLILSRALLHALHILDIPAQAANNVDFGLNQSSDSKKKKQNPVCFEVSSNYEIMINSKKLIGSAQARRREGVLQHGTFPLQGDLTRVIQALQFPTQEKRLLAEKRLLERATTAENVLGMPLSWQAAAKAFVQAFHETLNLELHSMELTHKERERTYELVEQKYANPQWTQRI
jgi:lipoate-protein ligase A